MDANKYVLLIVFSFLIVSSCSFKNELNGIWVSSDSKSLLEINGDKWKIIYSEVSGLCTQLRMIKDLGNSGALEIISPQDIDVDNPTNYQINKDELDLLGYKYLQIKKTKWDSILVYKGTHAETRMSLESKYISDLSMNNDLLVALIMVPQFNLIHPSNTATDYLIKYELWNNNKIIGSKIGGSNFLCISN